MIDPEKIWPLIARTEVILPGRPNPIRGTAFLISRTHVLTCAHCIGATDTKTPAVDVKLTFSRWQNNKEFSTSIDPTLISWERDAAIICLGQNSPEDISILQLLPNGLTDQKWKLCAYPTPTGNDGMVFEGTVADPGTIRYDKPAIQLNCPQAGASVKGASGGPLVTELGIFGLITKQLLNSQLEPVFDVLYACPLKEIEDLLSLVDVQLSPLLNKPMVTEFAQPDIISKLCDRELQSTQFVSCFGTETTIRPSVPQVYIVHGPLMESHRNLVIRLQNTEIKSTLRKQWGDSEGTRPCSLIVPWPHEDDLVANKEILKNNLFWGLEKIGLNPQDRTPAELANITKSASKIFIFEHEIHAKHWSSPTEQLIKWYVTFWHEVGKHNQALTEPVFLVFLHIIYPPNWGSRRFKDSTLFSLYTNHIKIPKKLKELQIPDGGVVTYQVLDELSPPMRRHIRDWFNSYKLFDNDVDKEQSISRVLTLPNGTVAEHRCMAEIEKELKQIWTEVRSPQKGVVL